MGCCCSGGGSSRTSEGKDTIDSIPPAPDRLKQPVMSTASSKSNGNATNIVVGIYDYKSKATKDLSFKKGDRMEILSNYKKDWLYGKHLGTGRKGYMPRSHLAPELSVESEEWFSGTSDRKDAEQLLLSNPDRRGIFLIRPSNHHKYSLCVTDSERNKRYFVKHFGIHYSNGIFDIWPEEPFSSLQDLVKYYYKHPIDPEAKLYLAKPCSNLQPSSCELTSHHTDKWEMDRKEIQLKKMLGEGHFGQVYHGLWKGNYDVAVKMLKNNSAGDREDFLKEAAIMKKLDDRNLVKLLGVCSKKQPFYIIEEYVEKGNLRDYLRRDDCPLEVPDLCVIAYQIARGMRFLERQNFIHRDLAARNVLLGRNNEAKICDFGMARIIQNDGYLSRADTLLSVKWAAPEAYLDRKATIKADVWSYGIVLMEIFTYGKTPYAGIRCQDVITMIQGGYRMPRPENLSSEIYNIMTRCWDNKPEERPSFEKLTNDFRNINVEKVFIVKRTLTPKYEKKKIIPGKKNI